MNPASSLYFAIWIKKMNPLLWYIYNMMKLKDSNMDYIEHINRAVCYMEANLKEPLNLDEIAREAAYSPFHFLRLFHTLIGETPGNYIRKRRLWEAAKELLMSNTPIIRIAFDYQFQSQEAFTRAFQKLFGLTPRKYRLKGKSSSGFAKSKLSRGKIMHLLQGVTMEPKMIEKKELNLVGLVYYGDNKKWEIPELWGKFLILMASIPNRINEQSCYGLCFNSPDFCDTGMFCYLAAVEVSSLKEIPITMIGKTIPMNNYAVFTHKGNVKNIKTTYEYIYGTWLAKHGYENTSAYDFEFYDHRFNAENDEVSELDLYIPIKEQGKDA